jgi:predicted lactoylglutathione lyase
LEQTKKQLEEKTDLLDKIIAMLGNEDIKNTSNLTNLLQGKTLKEVITANSLYQQKIKDQDTALINLAKQKIKGKKATEKLLNELETN